MSAKERITLALPKGRILEEAMPLVRACGIEPEPDFDNPKSRKLKFETNIPYLDIIRVRSFDVATFVAFGAAHIGICGNDVMTEFDYPDIYAPLDLGIGFCRLAVAAPVDAISDDNPASWSHIRVATKYPHLTQNHFEERGVQAECVKLNGAMELAPQLGLCRLIVDLVSSGDTLKANGLVEVEHICDVTSRLIFNRPAFKTNSDEMQKWLSKFTEAVDASAS